MVNQENIFDIQVNENGKRTVSQIYSLVKIIFWVGLAVQIIILVNGVISYFRLRDTKFINFLYLRIYTAYLIFVAILVIFQLFYSLKFSRQAHESIKANDSIGFNNSFTWIFKSLKIGLITISLNGLFFLYTIIFQNLKYFKG
jgi:hypothetical protein